MPSAFKTMSIETLEDRRESVAREILGLVRFQERIERRIAVLKAKPIPSNLTIDGRYGTDFLRLF